MKYPILLASDLHLSSAPSSEYRWRLFDQLGKLQQQHSIATLVLLGDLTDAKDGHTAALVNRIVSTLATLPFEEVVILSGNHDWLKAGEEFFRFLNYFPTMQFITAPTLLPIVGKKWHSALTLFLPYSKTPAADWAALDRQLWDVDYVFMHQTIKGSIASNGQVMEGEELLDLSTVLSTRTKVYSGDIHVPQTVGLVEYVGSPYHVHFGDKFKPRVVLLNGKGEAEDINLPNVQRLTVKVSSVSELRRVELRKGDHVKLRMELAESDKHAWLKIKREAVAVLEAAEVEVYGVELLVRKAARRVALRGDSGPITSRVRSLEDHLAAFVVAESLGGDALEAGLDIVEGKE